MYRFGMRIRCHLPLQFCFGCQTLGTLKVDTASMRAAARWKNMTRIDPRVTADDSATIQDSIQAFLQIYYN